jgi:hypothetical protein
MFGKNINKYSPKISKVLKYLSRCIGVAMVYTFWIPGILPMAFALKRQGILVQVLASQHDVTQEW